MAETAGVSVRKSDRQRQRKELFRTLRLLRHAIPIAATHDHKSLPIFDPLGRSIAVAIAAAFLSYYLQPEICVWLVLYGNVIWEEREQPWSVKGKETKPAAMPCRFSHGRPPATVYGTSRYSQLPPHIE